MRIKRLKRTEVRKSKLKVAPAEWLEFIEI